MKDTKELLESLLLVSITLSEYVVDDETISDSEVDNINEAIADIREAIVNIKELEERLNYTKVVAETLQERAEEAEQLEIDNEQLKKAFDRACYWLADIQKQLFDIKKEITQLGMIYYVEESIESKPKEEWKRFLLG